MNKPQILIACVGNIFLGDDAFGVEVAAALQQRSLPEGVRVVDFGTRALDLAYATLDGWDALILVDATSRGSPPGTLYLIEPELSTCGAGVPPCGAGVSPCGAGVSPALTPAGETPAPQGIDMHGMDPARVLDMARSLGAPLGRVLVVGCEPMRLDEGAAPWGLSPPVCAAVPEALRLIDSLLADLDGLELSARSTTLPHVRQVAAAAETLTSQT